MNFIHSKTLPYPFFGKMLQGLCPKTGLCCQPTACVLQTLLLRSRGESSFNESYPFYLLFQHFLEAVKSLAPNPVDSVQLWMKNVVLCCMTDKGSRHNAPMLPHSFQTLVKQGLPGYPQEYVLVSSFLEKFSMRI